MKIDMLVNTQILCEEIREGRLENILILLEHLKCFDMQYVFDEENIGELFSLLFQNRRVEACRELSIFLDRNREREAKEFNQALYDEKDEILCRLIAAESCELKEILYNKACFFEKEHLLAFGESDSLRLIKSDSDLYCVLTIFGQEIKDLHVFSNYIRDVYRNIVFDIDIEDSMKKLNAGFEQRRHEILYHLFCIHKEIPQIVKENGVLADRFVGEKMSVRCSPESGRNIVKAKLIKEADGKKIIKCELHTKMETLGSNKPDRIYFCASVPNGVTINGEDLSGKIYVYKITEHA